MLAVSRNPVGINHNIKSPELSGLSFPSAQVFLCSLGRGWYQKFSLLSGGSEPGYVPSVFFYKPLIDKSFQYNTVVGKGFAYNTAVLPYFCGGFYVRKRN